MAEQRRIGYRWHPRALMAQRNLWKSTELVPLLRARGINLSESQICRLVTGTPERTGADVRGVVRPPRLHAQRVVRTGAGATGRSHRGRAATQRGPRDRSVPIAQRIRLVDPDTADERGGE